MMCKAQYYSQLLVLLLFSIAISFTLAFAPNGHKSTFNTITAPTSWHTSRVTPTDSMLYSTSAEAEESSSVSYFSLTLEKPLGMVLEEVIEDAPEGVYVQSVNEGGSAFKYTDKLLGLKLINVMDDDVTSISFDEVMEKIISAPSAVTIDFELNEDVADDKVDDDKIENEGPIVLDLAVGTDVFIKVLEEGKPELIIEAKVGDNLRKTLLENKVELYKGLKKKLGNCGGSGQCTFCAVDFVDSDGWERRSDYEESRIGKFPNARLACLNNIQASATIRVQ